MKEYKANKTDIINQQLCSTRGQIFTAHAQKFLFYGIQPELSHCQ